MRKFLLISFILTFLFLFTSSVKAEVLPVLSVDFNISVKGLSITIQNVAVLEADWATNEKDFNLINPDIFTVSLIDAKGSDLSSTKFNFIPPELIADYPYDKPDSVIQNIQLQYDNRAAKLIVKRRGNEILSYDLTPFCNHDSKQNNKETFLSCSSDVKAYAKDGYCNYKSGKEKPDPDCPANVDYDSRDIAKTISAVWGKEVKLNSQNQTKTQKTANQLFLYLALAGGGLILTAGIALAVFYFLKRRNQPPQPPSSSSPLSPTTPPIIPPPTSTQPPAEV